MSDGSVYDEDYFMRGPETGKSLYTLYSWKPDLTMPMVRTIVKHCGIVPRNASIRGDIGHRVLDFGCARGYLVKAFRNLGYEAYGVDCSQWAIDNADEEVRHFVGLLHHLQLEPKGFDWIIAKDVLEHIPYVRFKIKELMEVAKVGMFAVVPLVKFKGTPYVIADYEKDVTHVQRRTLAEWTEMFVQPGWRVEVSYRVPGVKDNYYKEGWELGNGFITCRRIEE